MADAHVKDELACTYAALILHDDNVPITASKMATLIKAAGVTVPAYYPSLFERVFASRSVDDLLANAAAAPGGAPAVAHAAPAAAGAAPAAGGKAEEKKEEKKAKKEEKAEEEEEAMGAFGLFGEGEEEDY